MKLLWTLLKIAIACVIIIPVAIIVLAMALGILGALVGLAILALKVGVVVLLVLVAIRALGWLFRAGAPHTQPEIRQLPPVDPHYEAAMRELNRELGETR
jgi:hypothetical protein